jgi:hypothetical protein
VFRDNQADIEDVRSWAPLPETADELCEVARRLGVPYSEILLGADATERRLKVLSEQDHLADYAILSRVVGAGPFFGWRSSQLLAAAILSPNSSRLSLC